MFERRCSDIHRSLVRYIPADMMPEVVTSSDEFAENAGEPTASDPASPAALPQGREALLDEILRIASAFRRSEPNSPISFTLEEAVRRARMPWPDLLRELVADQGARASMMTIAGLRAEGLAAADT